MSELEQNPERGEQTPEEADSLWEQVCRFFRG